MSAQTKVYRSFGPQALKGMETAVARSLPKLDYRSEAGHLGNLEERDWRLASQRRERPIAQVVIPLPELERSEVDVGERHVGRRITVLATRDTRPDHCCRHN